MGSRAFPIDYPQPQNQVASSNPVFAPRQPAAEVLPDVPAPTPAAEPTKTQPEIPYRSSSPTPAPSVTPPTPPAPSVEFPAPPTPAGGGGNPFQDDPSPATNVGEVLP